MAGVVAITPSFQLEDKSFPIYYYALVVLFFAIHQVTLYSMFVSVMAFFAKVSDPAVGGTYMTLLNTVTNLGGNWPSTLALWAVDPLTTKICQGGNSTITDCSASEALETCTGSGGDCATTVDGYYVEAFICFGLGLAWLGLWGWRTINKLQDAPDSAWAVVRWVEMEEISNPQKLKFTITSPISSRHKEKQ